MSDPSRMRSDRSFGTVPQGVGDWQAAAAVLLWLWRYGR